MAAEKKSTAPVGSVVEAKEVTRPDGRTVSVSGGYVLDVLGVHVIDGSEVEAK